VKLHLDVNENSDRFAVLGRRFEFPLAHCLDRLLVKTLTESPNDFDVVGLAIWTHNELKNGRPLELDALDWLCERRGRRRDYSCGGLTPLPILITGP